MEYNVQELTQSLNGGLSDFALKTAASLMLTNTSPIDSITNDNYAAGNQ